jgi:hypothetical protein
VHVVVAQALERKGDLHGRGRGSGRRAVGVPGGAGERTPHARAFIERRLVLIVRSWLVGTVDGCRLSRLQKTISSFPGRSLGSPQVEGPGAGFLGFGQAGSLTRTRHDLPAERLACGLLRAPGHSAGIGVFSGFFLGFSAPGHHAGIRGFHGLGFTETLDTPRPGHYAGAWGHQGSWTRETRRHAV